MEEREQPSDDRHACGNLRFDRGIRPVDRHQLNRDEGDHKATIDQLAIRPTYSMSPILPLSRMVRLGIPASVASDAEYPLHGCVELRPAAHDAGDARHRVRIQDQDHERLLRDALPPADKTVRRWPSRPSTGPIPNTRRPP